MVTAARSDSTHMHVAVIFDSTMGRTRAMAQAICEGARSEGRECELIEAASYQNLEDVCAVAVGSSTRIKKPLPAVREVLSSMTSLSGLAAASFGSYGWSGEAPEIIADILRSKGARIIQDEPLRAKDYPGEEKLDECRALGRRLAKECMH